MAENKIRALAQLTVRCEEADRIRFDEFHDALGFATKGETISAIFDRFELPQKVEDRTGELQNEIDNLRRIVAELEKNTADLKTENDNLRQDLDIANSVINDANNKYSTENTTLQSTITRLEHELNEARKAAHLPDDSAVIAFTPENLAVLDYVCNRESKRRNAPWSRSHVINHFINSRFIKGELNGDLRSVSDSDIEKIRKALKEQPTTENGQQTTDNGQQTTDNGQRTTDNGGKQLEL